MNTDASMFPPILFTLWWIGLVVTLVVFVPLAVYLLHGLLRAARSIESYAREALVAAGGIAQNTQHITALDSTIDVAGDMLGAAEAVATKLDTIATVLAARAR